MAKLKKGGAVTRALFNAAYGYKLFLLRQGLPFRCAGHGGGERRRAVASGGDPQ